MPCPGKERNRSFGIFVLFALILLPLQTNAVSLILGQGSQTSHLLILFTRDQTLECELHHNGSVRTGADLLTAVIQATGGSSVTTLAYEEDGNPITFSSQLPGWNGQGLFAHFYQYSFGVFINGFAWGASASSADDSWDSYFSYQIGGASADFTLAPFGATERTLSSGDYDAYVFTAAFPSPGLAAWQVANGITDLAADPDRDGMDNLLEFSLRRNPHISDAAGAVQSGVQLIGENSFLTLTYLRPHDEWATVPQGTDAIYDGVGYTVETSEDLVIWQSGTNYVTQSITPDATGSMATVVARVPTNSPRRFLRLRVHLP